LRAPASGAPDAQFSGKAFRTSAAIPAYRHWYRKPCARAFYANPVDARVLRFCFAKKAETLDRALDSLVKI
jgi:hypothetical protein